MLACTLVHVFICFLDLSLFKASFFSAQFKGEDNFLFLAGFYRIICYITEEEGEKATKKKNKKNNKINSEEKKGDFFFEWANGCILQVQECQGL